MLSHSTASDSIIDISCDAAISSFIASLIPSASNTLRVVLTQSTTVLRPAKRSPSRAITSIKRLASGSSSTACLMPSQPVATAFVVNARSISRRCCASCALSLNKKGDLIKSSSAAGRPRVLTKSSHEASTAAARVVDNFQPVSSETNTCARSSNARTRRATTRSCGTIRMRVLPS